MWRVMDLAAWQLLNFLTIIALLFVAFAVLAVSCFGYFMRTWHNVPTSLMTMIRMSMGEIGHGGYEDMKRAPGRTHSSTAPLFVMIYTLVFVVCLSNLFVAILTDMYYLARNELSVCRRFERCIKKELLCALNSVYKFMRSNYTKSHVLSSRALSDCISSASRSC